MKANRLFIACVATVALAACGGATELTATLSGAAEKPNAVTTNGSGNVKVTIDGSKLSVSGSFKDLGSNATAAHIHGPVKADGTGDVFCNLKVPTGFSGSISGDADANACGGKELTEAQIADFEGGKMYVNIHTASNAGGEIRGDLSKAD